MCPAVKGRASWMLIDRTTAAFDDATPEFCQDNGASRVKTRSHRGPCPFSPPSFQRLGPGYGLVPAILKFPAQVRPNDCAGETQRQGRGYDLSAATGVRTRKASSHPGRMLLAKSLQTWALRRAIDKQHEGLSSKNSTKASYIDFLDILRCRSSR